MTRARSTVVSPSDTPYYHCIGRCVRRAFLCGKDPVTGKSFDHRKQRILERLALLTEVFAIDLCAYALMSNHYHLVLRLDTARAAAWSEREVMERWRRIYVGPACVSLYLDGAPLTAADTSVIANCVRQWRERLVDLSWFMRCLNEYIARMANTEDECTGRFWEGRFKSQALLDEEALLTVMAYVDLNPVRAGIADSIESSDFISAQQRLEEHSGNAPSKVSRPALLPFAQALRRNEGDGLPFNLQDYLELLDNTGRVVHADRKAPALAATPRLLSALGLEPGEWVKAVAELHVRFRLFIGAPHRLSTVAESRGWRWIRGQSAARRLYRRVNE